jgi:hypothetical protein
MAADCDICGYALSPPTVGALPCLVEGGGSGGTGAKHEQLQQEKKIERHMFHAACVEGLALLGVAAACPHCGPMSDDGVNNLVNDKEGVSGICFQRSSSGVLQETGLDAGVGDVSCFSGDGNDIVAGATPPTSTSNASTAARSIPLSPTDLNEQVRDVMEVDTYLHHLNRNFPVAPIYIFPSISEQGSRLFFRLDRKVLRNEASWDALSSEEKVARRGLVQTTISS